MINDDGKLHDSREDLLGVATSADLAPPQVLEEFPTVIVYFNSIILATTYNESIKTENLYTHIMRT